VVYSIDLIGSVRTILAYIHALEMKTSKVQKTQYYGMVYSDEVSGSLSTSLAYIDPSEMETSNQRQIRK